MFPRPGKNSIRSSSHYAHLTDFSIDVDLGRHDKSPNGGLTNGPVVPCRQIRVTNAGAGTNVTVHKPNGDTEILTDNPNDGDTFDVEAIGIDVNTDVTSLLVLW